MFRAVVFQLIANNTGKLPAHHGHMTNGAFYGIVGSVDRGLSTQLHEKKIGMPVTISPILTPQPPYKAATHIHAGKTYLMRFTFVDDDVYMPLIQFFMSGGQVPPIAIGPVDFTVHHIIMSKTGHDLAGTSTLDGIASTVDYTPSDEMRVRFYTPTTFTMGKWNSGGRRFLVYPEPKMLWKNWRKAWANAGGDDPGPDFDQWVQQSVSITRYRLESELVKFPRYRILGFTGWATYRVDRSAGDDANFHLWWQLAQFSRYVGSGYHTAQGMGLVGADSAEQHPDD